MSGAASAKPKNFEETEYVLYVNSCSSMTRQIKFSKDNFMDSG
jgi:hypothetical protein